MARRIAVRLVSALTVLALLAGPALAVTRCRGVCRPMLCCEHEASSHATVSEVRDCCIGPARVAQPTREKAVRELEVWATASPRPAGSIFDPRPKYPPIIIAAPPLPALEDLYLRKQALLL
jgi:hypothetical protein